MSPRRALATAAIMAVVPTCIFFVGGSKYSVEICDQVVEQLQVPAIKKDGMKVMCNKTIQESYSNAYYWLLLTSILINWPVIRWLDDRQWYREWIREEDNNSNPINK